MERLPIELVEKCLSYVHHWGYRRSFYSMGKDLASCSLVCHSWRAIAQTFLFHELQYPFTKPPRTGQTRFLEGDSSGNEVPSVYASPQTLRSLHTFLRACPHLASCIRTLWLDSDSGALDFKRYWGDAPTHSVDPRDFDAVLTLLPRLRDLRLLNVVFKRDNIDEARRPRPALDVLILRYTHAYKILGAEDLRRLVSSFSRIGMFKLVNSSMSEQQIYAYAYKYVPLQRPVEVQHIIFETKAASTLGDMLCATIDVDRVRRLDIQPDQALAFQDILHSVSSGLEELHFEMEPVSVNREDDQPPGAHSDWQLDIRPCRNLKSLHISFVVHGSTTPPTAEGWPWRADSLQEFIVHAEFSPTAYPCLRTIVLRLYIGIEYFGPDPPHGLAGPVDDALVDIVDRMALPGITFEWEPSGRRHAETLTGDLFAEYVYKTFPMLRQRDLILIQAPSEGE